MKIFNHTPIMNNQTSLKTSSKQATQSAPQSPIKRYYEPNAYFHPAQLSFGALKKHDFEGIDIAVVEKFKAPIEKFNSNDDLQDWAEIQATEIANTDFGGRQAETRIQRKTMIKEWTDYVLKENDAYNNATSLLILNAITKNLKPDNDKLPPGLNKGVLADCISEIDKNIKSDRKYQFDLNKMYETKLCAIYFKDTTINGENTGWVKIPSETNDPKNFEENVEKLKTLSHKNWCTKSFNAEPYLRDGDFHVYLENGQPKLGVRFVGDKIQEIQGELNNGEIPILYFDEVEKHIDENNFMLTANAYKGIQKAEETKEEIEKIKNDLKSAIEVNDVKTIFEYFNIDIEEDEDGLLTISEYNQPSDQFNFSYIGIDENLLFEKIKEIKHGAHFYNSQVTNLGNLKTIGWIANFYNSKVTNLSNLEKINGDVYFADSQVTNLDNLKTIDGDAYFSNSRVTNLGNLETINGNAYFINSQLTTLGKLKSIGGSASFEDSKIKNLGNLETIGKNAFFENSTITDLGNLKIIGGDVSIKNSPLTLKDFEDIHVGKLRYW